MVATTNDFYPVILDIGPRYIRAGFAGESAPIATIKIINYDNTPANGIPPYFNTNDASMTSDQQDMVISSLIESDPVVGKLFKVYNNDHANWMSMEKIPESDIQFLLLNIFKDHLIVSPSRTKVILIDSNISILNKSIISNILLFKVGVRSIIWLPESTLTVISACNTNGMVINIRWDTLYISPVIDLRVIHLLEDHNKLNGCSLHYKVVEKLLELNDENVNDLLTKDSFELIEDFVLNAMYVRHIDDKAEDFQLYEVSEGVNIPNKLRYEIIESLFFDKFTLSQEIITIVKKSPIDIRTILLQNILLIGEISNIAGFKARLMQEIRLLASSKAISNINLGLWTGCSLYCSTTLIRNNEFWKSEEITRDKLNQSISENGIKLANIPDSFNSLYKYGVS